MYFLLLLFLCLPFLPLRLAAEHKDVKAQYGEESGADGGHNNSNGNESH